MSARFVQMIEIGHDGQDIQKKFEAFTSAFTGSDIEWDVIAGQLYTEYLRWEAFPDEVEDRIVVEQTIIANADSLEPPPATSWTLFQVRFGFGRGAGFKKEPDRRNVLRTTKFVSPFHKQP
jgi:hypothetical protein